MKFLAIAFIIFVWLRTNAFVDLLGWAFAPLNMFYVRDYNSQPDNYKNNVDYPLWLHVTYKSYFTTLISCPLCLSFWISLIASWNSGLVSVMTTAYLTLLSYSVINKLYKHG